MQKYITQNFITFALYFFATYLIINILNEPIQAVLVWPAVGVGIITALVWGYRVLPGLYLAQLTLSIMLYTGNFQDYSLASFAISNTFIVVGLIRCYLGAYLIKSTIGYPNSLTAYRSIFYFFVIIAPVVSFISTVLNSIVKYFHGFLNSSSVVSNALDWWYGDFIGFVIFAPLTMVIISQPKSIWRPRYLTLGLPVVLTFFLIIFVFNRTQESNTEQIVNELKIKSELITTKVSEKINSVNEFLNNSLVYFFADDDKKRQLETYISLIEINKNYLKTIIYMDKEQQYFKSSTGLPLAELDSIKSFDFKKYIDNQRNNNIFGQINYVAELQAFVSLFELLKLDNSIIIIAVHDTLGLLSKLTKRYNLDHIKIDLNNQEQIIELINSQESLPINKHTVAEKLSLNQHNFKLLFTPTIAYFNNKNFNSNFIIAKLGFLFSGLIGIMLLIITGKTALTDIQVKERTLELDTKVNRFIDHRQQYIKLIELHPVVLWQQNIITNQVTYISDKVEEIYGYPATSWLNSKDFWMNHIHKQDQAYVRNTINLAINDKTPFALEYRFIKADFTIAWIKDVVNFNKDESGNTQLVGLMIDISESKEARKGQSISESKYRTLFKHAADPLIIIDLDENTFKDSNDKAIALFGLNNIIGHVSLAEFSPIKQPNGSNSKKTLQSIYQKLNKHHSYSFKWSMLDKTHKEIICNIDLVKLPEDNHNIALANINDITEKLQYEKKIKYLAYYDNLTSLPNREYFYSKFSYFHKKAQDSGMFGTIIYLDLDRFKILNDSLGHQAGDNLLKMVGARIVSVLNKNDFCARLGGDEFIILTKKLNKSMEASLESSLVKSELILEALNRPYQLDDYVHQITPSIGISIYPSGNASIDQIIHQADIAMYTSKEKGENTITIYQESMVKFVGKRLRIEKAIREAIDKNEFELFYQPIINIKSENLAVEALLRWQRLTELNLNTEELIETIERIGLTHELGYWVFDQACTQLEKWQLQGHSIQSIAINVSSKQFHRDFFVDQIKSIISSYNIYPSQIVIELTEAIIIKDMASLIYKLNDLRKFGIKISLDDFGTGYSSLAYLKHLPIDQLKIDKVFVHDLSFDESSQHIIKTIIKLAKLMNINLLAEGVELKEQFDILKELGCERFQGFYFSKPLAAKKLFKTVASSHIS